MSPTVVEAGLRDLLQAADQEEGRLVGATLFHRHAANFPWRSQTLWYARQMRRWGHLAGEIDLQTAIDRCVRPDLYRQAAADLGISVPLTDNKIEGAHEAPWQLEGDRGDIPMMPDRFLDGCHFKP